MERTDPDFYKWAQPTFHSTVNMRPLLARGLSSKLSAPPGTLSATLSTRRKSSRTVTKTAKAVALAELEHEEEQFSPTASVKTGTVTDKPTTLNVY